MTQPDIPLKSTPLHAAHVRLGARMIPFGGWDMPVQYAGIVEEHRSYGNDIDETTNPLEAGLGWVVKPAKGPFLGRAAIERVRAAGPSRRLVGFEMVDRAVPRHGYPILHDGASVGVVTSGSYGPSVDRYIGIGYVPAALAAVGSAIAVEVRGRGQAARVVKTPFHPPRVKR